MPDQTLPQEGESLREYSARMRYRIRRSLGPPPNDDLPSDTAEKDMTAENQTGQPRSDANEDAWARRVVALLNSSFEADQRATFALCQRHAEPCNDALASHLRGSDEDSTYRTDAYGSRRVVCLLDFLNSLLEPPRYVRLKYGEPGYAGIPSGRRCLGFELVTAETTTLPHVAADDHPYGRQATVTKPLAETDHLAGKIVALLNSAFAADPAAIHTLCINRVPCNGTLADHPTVIVDTLRVTDGTPQLPVVGLIGILNGLLPGPRHVGMDFETADDRRGLLGFKVVNINGHAPTTPVAAHDLRAVVIRAAGLPAEKVAELVNILDTICPYCHESYLPCNCAADD